MEYSSFTIGAIDFGFIWLLFFFKPFTALCYLSKLLSIVVNYLISRLLLFLTKNIQISVLEVVTMVIADVALDDLRICLGQIGNG